MSSVCPSIAILYGSAFITPAKPSKTGSIFRLIVALPEENKVFPLNVTAPPMGPFLMGNYR